MVLSSGSGGSLVFFDHVTEYAVASDQAVEGQGGWSVHSVRMNRSASQFARVVYGDVLMIMMFSLPNTASKLAVNLASLSRMRKGADSIAPTQGQVASDLSEPLPRWIGGHPQG